MSTSKHLDLEQGIERVKSPALYLGELQLSERRASRRKGLRSAGIKNVLVGSCFWLAHHMPLWITKSCLYMTIGLLRLGYWVPGNGLRHSCALVAKLCAAKGYNHEPAQIYRDFLHRTFHVLEGYVRLYRNGVQDMLERFEVVEPGKKILLDAMERYGCAVVAAPHNIASVFSGIEFSRIVPALLVAKNAPSIKRTKIVINIFERMKVKALLVREGNPFALTRACLQALRDRKFLVATLDSVYRKKNVIPAKIFGREVGFAPWAARIAIKAGAPIIPLYIESHGRSVRFNVGEPLVTENLEEAMQHYVDYFEQGIYRDPASWSFLADNRWRKEMKAAVAGL